MDLREKGVFYTNVQERLPLPARSVSIHITGVHTAVCTMMCSKRPFTALCHARDLGLLPVVVCGVPGKSGTELLVRLGSAQLAALHMTSAARGWRSCVHLELEGSLGMQYMVLHIDKVDAKPADLRDTVTLLGSRSMIDDIEPETARDALLLLGVFMARACALYCLNINGVQVQLQSVVPVLDEYLQRLPCSADVDLHDLHDSEYYPELLSLDMDTLTCCMYIVVGMRIGVTLTAMYRPPCGKGTQKEKDTHISLFEMMGLRGTSSSSSSRKRARV